MTTETLAAADPAAARRERGTRARARNSSMLRTILRSKLAVAGIVLVLIFILVAILGSTLAPYNPSATSNTLLQPPSASHLLGTTQTGQDVLSQLLVAAGPSLAVGFLAAGIATVLSVIIGVAGGYFRGFAGDTLSSFANVFVVVPSLPLIIVLAAYLPTKSAVPMAIVISVTGWAWGARLMRVQTLSLRQREHIVAARAIGERTWRIMFVELMPGLLPIITSAFLFTVVFAIVTQAGLAFLGLTDISSWSWGTMLYWSQNDQAFTLGAWWWYVPPGLCIALLGMGMGLINFALDELINPRLRDVRPPRRSGARQRRQPITPMSNQQGR